MGGVVVEESLHQCGDPWSASTSSSTGLLAASLDWCACSRPVPGAGAYPRQPNGGQWIDSVYGGCRLPPPPDRSPQPSRLGVIWWLYSGCQDTTRTHPDNLPVGAVVIMVAVRLRIGLGAMFDLPAGVLPLCADPNLETIQSTLPVLGATDEWRGKEGRPRFETARSSSSRAFGTLSCFS